MTGQKFIKSGYKYTREEKLSIIKDYLTSDLSKNAIEKKYGISNGILSQWLRIFGADKNTKSVMLRKISKRKTEESGDKKIIGENQELVKRIAELEKELEYEKLRSLAYSTLIDIAEKDFNIEIRKKDGAKQ